MKDDGAWDRDPFPDPVLQRLLGRVSVPPLGEADRSRLEGAIMSAVGREAARAAPAWWEIAARWAPAAAAAGVAAVLVSGLVLFGSRFQASADSEAAPETAAVAQVIDRYPGDAVLASLISGDDTDALSPWREP
ncbi:MAG TPA: hypothetical protein VFT28_00155 [Gemmatimonadales bacterium]|nr:hypothetical protein [Gemmatimonadales bacterium]